ncbi:cytochrome P450 11A1, mitochondrial [Anopheles darlingi]|uniref:Cytochrome P450 11A1, mitochondrial n=1 Tax=Anopheles darlingi TaxID=43151 RepID=W5J2W2_ANODA|nr:cytochrome P450 11A1, mitochondrial [Anopheles darlingi]
MELVSIIIAVIALCATVVYLFLRRQQNYWKSRGFPTLPDEPHLLYGHTKGVNTVRHASAVSAENYQRLKRSGAAFGGINILILPVVTLVDPEVIKTILVKDFNVFHDRGMYSDADADPLSATLFALAGKSWRSLRHKLTPTFTSGKMKFMFGTILEVADELHRYVDEHAVQGELEMKDILVRFTTDIIGTCAFGIECNTLRNPDSEFLKYGHRVFEQTSYKMLKVMFTMTLPKLAKKVGVKVTDTELETFFLGLVRETVEHREKHNVQRNDFLNLLIEIKNKGSVQDGGDAIAPEEPGMTMNELAAQVFIFFLAGFETSSTTMNFCLYELVKHPDIQERLRNEINAAIEANGGQLTYDVVMNIQYLDHVINETLRKYPPLETITRAPERDYTVPGTTHVIPKGAMIQIPIYGLHHDPDYYPNPERFDPERFTPEEVKKRPAYVFLPFGEGPRNCIGLRFGLMQTKVGLITLLRNFRFSATERTPESITFLPSVFVLTPDKGNYLQVDKL